MVLWKLLWWVLLYPIYSWGYYLLWPPSWSAITEAGKANNRPWMSPWLVVPFFPIWYYTSILYVGGMWALQWWKAAEKG